jgi:Inosine-uridine preferring nucleoside hydrolase
MPTSRRDHRSTMGHRAGRGMPLGALTLVIGLLVPFLAGCATRAASTATAGTSPRVIIDTDLSLYWDDATAVGLANVLQQQGKVRILGVVSDVPNPVAVGALDAIDTAYGHGAIPVGAVKGSAANTAPHGYSDALVNRLPHAIRDSSDAPGAVSVYRRSLSAQPDHSVTVVALGAYTNLAGLLRSGPGQGSSLDGRTLVATKVKRLVIEDGLFPVGGPPFTNERLDVASARVVVGPGGWPTPIAWVDGYTGIATRVGGMLCTTVPSTNPMRVVYQTLFGCGPPGDGDWDGPTMVYAIEGGSGTFSELGQGGAAVINSQSGLSWASGSGHPKEVYVHVRDQAALNAQIDKLIDTP